MDFIKELQEGRMIRDKTNARVLTYADCCERLYISLLVIELMRQFPYSTSFVRSYCKRTITTDFQHFMISGTDIHNLVHFVTGDDETIGKLKNPGSARKARQQTNLPIKDVRSYLSSISNGNKPSTAQQLLIKLETALSITNQDYKNIRRKLSVWSTVSKQDQKAITTRLIFAARAKLRSSDLIDDLSKLVAQQDLESNWIVDPEPTISKPDMTTQSADYVYYRLLADPKNLMLIKAFLELMADGKAIPSNMVKAYAPIAKAMDDIVKGGPSYINLFKSIQKRAKNSLN